MGTRGTCLSAWSRDLEMLVGADPWDPTAESFLFFLSSRLRLAAFLHGF